MTTSDLTVLDWMLAPSLLILAAVLLNARDRFTSIVLYIVFGLIMAVAWARLDAVDIALAEAAIGAGITGALLLATYGKITAGQGEDQGPPERRDRRLGRRKLFAALLVAPLALLLGAAVLAAPPELERLEPRVASELATAGVEHRVTAVLLSFRAYDTLLELAILLIAVIGIWALRLPATVRVASSMPLITSAERLLVPSVILLGGYLLWRGSHGPGGAFQGGAVIASAAVLAHLGFHSAWPRIYERVINPGLALGLTVFGLIGLATASFGAGFLHYRGELAASLIVIIEVAATISIALALLAVFVGHPPGGSTEEP
jgi:multisubunit Na+/H+ antiporter MnhB subunit